MVVISNGLGHFHLRQAAEFAHQDRQLTLFVTGGYPAGFLGGRLSQLPLAISRRWLTRRIAVDDQLVRQFLLPDIANQVAGICLKSKCLRRYNAKLLSRSLDLYTSRLGKVLSSAAPENDILHYRSGFGGQSALATAKSKGMFLLCDHSIAHPQVLPGLVSGRFDGTLTPRDQLNVFQKKILHDLDMADHILVNSDFVLETFLSAGVPREAMSVIYTLPEQDFGVHSIRSSPSPQYPLKVFFAGTVDQRKGFPELMRIVEASGTDIDFTIVGQVDGICAEAARALNRRRNVQFPGLLGRSALAKFMATQDVLVFPTRAEGSARVVAEAMSLGCAVLTTRQAGSLLPAANWQVSEAGDWQSLAFKLGNLNADRSHALRLGFENRDLLSKHSQIPYGKRVCNLYAWINGRSGGV